MHTKNKSSANHSPTLKLTVDGTLFTYREFGKKEGTPIILLNHFSAVIDDWDPRAIDGIAKEKWNIIFDNRGVGGSQGKTPATVQAMADDAIEFETLGLVLLITYPDAGYGGIFQFHQDFVGKGIQFLE